MYMCKIMPSSTNFGDRYWILTEGCDSQASPEHNAVAVRHRLGKVPVRLYEVEMERFFLRRSNL